MDDVTTIILRFRDLVTDLDQTVKNHTSLIKSYKFTSLGYPTQRFVFDYETLNAEGKIRIRVDNRTHTIRFDKQDSKLGYRFIFVSSRYVK